MGCGGGGSGDDELSSSRCSKTITELLCSVCCWSDKLFFQCPFSSFMAAANMATFPVSMFVKRARRG